MAFKRGTDRKQTVLFPESLDEYVAADSPVRLIDAFADSLDMIALGFHRVEPDDMGRPAYDPRVLLKVLIYGYFYGARSSRRMERECKVNVEVMWLTGKLTPDHNTLSEFRKGNIHCMKPMFREFNRFCLRMDMFRLDYVSIDGSKFRAVNSKDRNFTLSKLDDRLRGWTRILTNISWRWRKATGMTYASCPGGRWRRSLPRSRSARPVTRDT